ncbi:MAG: hypothetical protein HYX92_11175 [Chloroflexi bacterium]|nr:hypothetical protein [Chloroflexota bacterium]
MGERFEVVWPLGKSVYETIPLAPPASDLRGKTICELWDWRFRGDEIFLHLRELLSKQYARIKFVDYSAFGNTHDTREKELIRALPHLLWQNGCDAVISAIGA